jgi:Gas vesicle synthesis protein GvpL/GvpF
MHRPGLSLPEKGVNGAAIQVIAENELLLLWSEVEWPLQLAAIQQNATDFHRAVRHVFSQTAVIPFRLLSLFESREQAAEFAARHYASFAADLDRLKKYVQMECVIFSRPKTSDASSGKAYLQQKAQVRRAMAEFAQQVRDAVAGINQEIREKEVKNGVRMYVLVERGQEEIFVQRVQSLPPPPGLERRTSGPWPAAEFLSESVKTPELKGKEQR